MTRRKEYVNFMRTLEEARNGAYRMSIRFTKGHVERQGNLNGVGLCS